MRSLQVQMIEDKESEKRYSDLQVLRSAAGFYIGTIYNNPEMGGFQEPGSRDSTYFEHEEIAEQALAKLEHFYATIPEEDLAITTWEAYLFKEGLDPWLTGYRFYP